MRRPPAGRVPTFVTPASIGGQPPEPVEPLDDWQTEGLAGSHQQRATAARGLHALLWTLLVGAVLLGLLGLANLGGRGTGAAAAAPTVTAPAPDVPPGGCAELLVSAWLAGDTTVLGSLVSAEVPRLPAGQRTATHTYTVSARAAAAAPAGTASWSYVVGADVVTVDKAGRSTAAGVQFFTVTLARQPGAPSAGGSCAGWAAPALPAQVAGLAPAARHDLGYDQPVAASGQPIAQTLGPFFTALLAGGPEVERYLAPGVAIAAVSPAPYSAVRLVKLAAIKGDQTGAGQALPADGTRIRLLATIAAKVGDQPGEWTLTYPLSMWVRGGRWEVTGLDSAPAFAAPTPSTSPQPGINRPFARPGTTSGPAAASNTPTATR